PSCFIRARNDAYRSPLLSQRPSATFRTWPSRVGGLGNVAPAGSHSRTLVAPTPQATSPTGTPNFSAMASPNGGRKLPPVPLPPGCGSSASCHRVPSTAATRPVLVVCVSAPWLAEFDCPATTNTSPTPTRSTVACANALPPATARTSSRYQPPVATLT